MTAVRHLVTMLVVLSLGASCLWAGYEEGVAAFKKKKYKEAVSEFQTELKARPNWYFPHYMMGLSQVQLRQYSEATKSLLTALDVTDNDGEKVRIQTALGKAYLYQKSTTTQRRPTAPPPTARPVTNATESKLMRVMATP